MSTNKRKTGLQDPNLHRDICFLIKRYLKGDFFLDFFANVPNLIYTLYQGGYDHTMDYESLYGTDYILKIVIALKLLRFFHLDEVQDTFTRLFD